jgi:hypothetical protein
MWQATSAVANSLGVHSIVAKLGRLMSLIDAAASTGVARRRLAHCLFVSLPSTLYGRQPTNYYFFNVSRMNPSNNEDSFPTLCPIGYVLQLKE